MSTTHRRTWRGRVLPRSGDDLEDQGLGFDVATLVGRRSVLRFAGLGAVGVGAVACGGDATSSTSSAPGTSPATAAASPTAAASATASAVAVGEEIPEETAGPFPGDGSNGPDVLEESGIVRSDIRASFGDASGVAEGVPMTLELAISDLAAGGSAYAGAAVYVWQCDRDGNYSMYSDATESENYLRGVQVADGDGIVRFTSIFPGCYPGRWPHLHFEVYPDAGSISDSTNAVATSQVALPQSTSEAVYATDGYAASITNLADISLRSDGVFGDDGGASQLGTVTGDATSGYAVRLAVRVDATTAAGGGVFNGGGRG